MREIFPYSSLCSSMSKVVNVHDPFGWELDNMRERVVEFPSRLILISLLDYKS